MRSLRKIRVNLYRRTLQMLQVLEAALVCDWGLAYRYHTLALGRKTTLVGVNVCAALVFWSDREWKKRRVNTFS